MNIRGFQISVAEKQIFRKPFFPSNTLVITSFFADWSSDSAQKALTNMLGGFVSNYLTQEYLYCSHSSLLNIPDGPVSHRETGLTTQYYSQHDRQCSVHTDQYTLGNIQQSIQHTFGCIQQSVQHTFGFIKQFVHHTFWCIQQTVKQTF